MRQPLLLTLVVLLQVLALVACQREAVVVQRQVPPGGEPAGGVPQTSLVPGLPVTTFVEPQNPYSGDVQGIHEGRRLYHWMNCSGCHFGGGGGIGPPLMDDDWIHGGRPAQIFDSIASGRANGMPAYGAMLASDQIWQIVAYVETLGREGQDAGGR